MSQIGALSIAITADGGQAISELGKVDGSQKSLSKRIAGSMKSWAKWGAAAAAAAAAVAVALTKSQMTVVDNLAKSARSVDGSIEGLQALSLAAREAGVSQEAAASSAQMLNARLGEAMRGMGQAKDQLDRLGLSAEQLSRMDVDERFAVISARMREMNMTSAQSADALRNLGIRNRDMILLMQSGESAIADARSRIQEYGLALSEVDAAKVEQANDTMAFGADIIKNIFQRAAIEVAPVIQALGERFLASAKEAGGLGNVVSKVFDFLVKAVARAADAVSAIRRAIQTVGNYWDFTISAMVGAWGKFWAAVMRGVDKGINFVIEGINVLIRQLNRIPKVNIDEIADSNLAANAADFFDKVGGAAVERMENAYDRTIETWSQPWPGAAVESFVEGAREASRKAAEEAVAVREEVMGAQGESPMFKHTEEENQKWLDALRERFMTEDEIYQEKYAADLERLKEAREQELIAEDEYLTRLNQLEEDAAQRRLQTAEDERRARIGIISSMMNNLSQLMNTGSKKMFAIGKAAAIANALVQGKEAVVSSYAAGARIGGPYVGAAFAATAAAATMAQINQIKSSSFGGAGGVTTFSGGVPAVRTTPAGMGGAPMGQTVDINITGSGNNFTADQVRQLIGQINEQVGDGVNLAFRG